MNRFVKYLILSDLFFWSAWGLVSPLFAIFVVDKIEGGSLLVVGIASGIALVLKSVLRIPIGIFIDKFDGEKDDYFCLVIGLFIAALTAFGFIFASKVWHIYLLQALQGIGVAVSLSAWSPIFSRHIDDKKRALEWGLDATAIGVGTGVTSIIGSWAVARFGFDSVFFCVGVIGIVGALILLPIKKDVQKEKTPGLTFSFKDIFTNNK